MLLQGAKGLEAQATQNQIALLREVYEAAMAVHLCEDFEEMPCQHECCAPQDWNAYQETRHKLYEALLAVEESVNEVH